VPAPALALALARSDGTITCGSFDECGVCNGDGSSCACAWYDACGVCEGDGSSCGGSGGGDGGGGGMITRASRTAAAKPRLALVSRH